MAVFGCSVYRIFLAGIIIFVMLRLLELNFSPGVQEGSMASHRSRIDFVDIVRIFSNQNIPMYLFDEELVMSDKSSAPHIHYYHIRDKRAILLGIDSRTFSEQKELEIMRLLKEHNFTVMHLYSIKPSINKVNRIIISFVFERYTTCQCLVLYSREDSTWWYGNILSNKSVISKYGIEGMQTDEGMLAYEGLISKFEVTSKQISSQEVIVLVPKYFEKFMNEFSESFFVECNFTRAEIFKNRYPSENNTSNLRFKHRAWKLLSLVKTILDGISVKFWLSSGTCLGYFRECDFIPYSSDVDIGIFADDYNDNIISEMIAHGFIWKHWFGLRNDSLELSFVDKNGLKLDIFFFYEEGNTFWNGGTQARTGMKFKYIFPKFKLCWTLFQYLKVRIPCNTEQYIIANYGPNWFTQVRHWDWKSSPFNVVQNGKWSKEELMYANRISP